MHTRSLTRGLKTSHFRVTPVIIMGSAKHKRKKIVLLIKKYEPVMTFKIKEKNAAITSYFVKTDDVGKHRGYGCQHQT